ncbi:hypothetical protein [uncultured Brevundimonas sp.]|uniref:hypothetical protein n=1 Tax=uncultured Brevundimonas sp. TaxID=213418 RepID=UPI0030EE155D|tara:strand:- start:21237 stop:21824 length:588 start_codon:yes stop_codon:yes gene_type:complete
MVIATLFVAAVLAGGPDPDGVVATAPVTMVQLDATTVPEVGSPAAAVQAAAPHGLTTDQQVSRWVAERTPEARPFALTDGGGPVDDRQMHGVVSVGIGTGDYRDYAVGVSLPVGENGRLDLTYRQVENGWPVYGYGYPAYGEGYSVFGSERQADDCSFSEAVSIRRPGSTSMIGDRRVSNDDRRCRSRVPVAPKR